MTNVDDAYALRRKLTNYRKKMLDVVALQAAGWLIHEDDAGARRNGATNFDDLTGRDRQGGDGGFGRYLGMIEGRQHFVGAFPQALAVEHSGARRFNSHHDVFRD